MDKLNIVLDEVLRMNFQSQRIDINHERINDVAKTIQEKNQIIGERGRTICSKYEKRDARYANPYWTKKYCK